MAVISLPKSDPRFEHPPQKALRLPEDILSLLANKSGVPLLELLGSIATTPADVIDVAPQGEITLPQTYSVDPKTGYRNIDLGMARHPSQPPPPTTAEQRKQFHRENVPGMLPLSTTRDLLSLLGEAVVDVTPVVGDIKAGAEAVADPSWINIGAAALGTIPVVGDVGAKMLKSAKGRSVIKRISDDLFDVYEEVPDVKKTGFVLPNGKKIEVENHPLAVIRATEGDEAARKLERVSDWQTEVDENRWGPLLDQVMDEGGVRVNKRGRAGEVFLEFGASPTPSARKAIIEMAEEANVVVLEGARGEKVLYNPTRIDISATIRSLTQKPVSGSSGVSEAALDAKKVYHGTPHTFAPEPGYPLGRFERGHIGKGEGGAAYGVGEGGYHGDLYETGDAYRKGLEPGGGSEPQDIARRVMDESPDKASAVKELNIRKAHSQDPEFHKSMDAAIESLERGTYKGNVYESALHAVDDEFLHWDKPLSEQSQKVQAVIRQSDWYKEVLRSRDAGETSNLSSMLYKHSDPEKIDVGEVYKSISASHPSRFDDIGTSKWLESKGLKGIKFLDQGSRNQMLQMSPDIGNKYGFAPSTLRNSVFGFADDAKNNVDVLIDKLHSLKNKNNTQIKALEALEAGDMWFSNTSNYIVFNPDDLEILRILGLTGAVLGTGAAVGAGTVLDDEVVPGG